MLRQLIIFLSSLHMATSLSASRCLLRGIHFIVVEQDVAWLVMGMGCHLCLSCVVLNRNYEKNTTEVYL